MKDTKNFDQIALNTTQTSLLIGKWKFLKVTAGDAAAHIMLVNSPVKKESGDYMEIAAGKTCFIELEPDGYYWLWAKTATGTSTLSVVGSNERILWMA